ncbi:UNVERIFIED_CONTAM: hypothetical protein GTU68_043829 [Idotea baltica]|nr:hypothetical protein [Idotea baltica]
MAPTKHRAKLALPALYAIVNVDDKQRNIAEYVTQLLGAGISIIQLRNKSLSESEALDTFYACLAARKAYPYAKILINDSVEIAQKLNADGVHLGQSDCCPKLARKTLGPSAIIGLSNHNLEQIERAAVEELNYLALGPIYHSTTKSGHAPEVGIANLARASSISSLPVVAIGGIDTARAAGVFAAGARSIAVISDLAKQDNLGEYNKLIELMRDQAATN